LLELHHEPEGDEEQHVATRDAAAHEEPLLHDGEKETPKGSCIFFQTTFENVIDQIRVFSAGTSSAATRHDVTTAVPTTAIVRRCKRSFVV
jgi:hypothetical protein